MKKLSLIIIVLLLPFFAFWQNNELTKNSETKEKASVTHEHISMWFFECDWDINQRTKTLNSAVNQWEPFEVCTIWTNNSSEDAQIEVDYNKSVYTPQWSKTCGNESIQEFIISDGDINNFIIPSNNYVVKKFSILFPVWIDWQQEECMRYRVSSVNKNKEENSSVGIVVRMNKWVYMDFFVWNLEDIKNNMVFENIKTELDSNKELILNMDIKNIWNLENDVNITWKITNMFWFSKDFIITGGKVIPTRTTPIKANLWQLPSYWWLFNIEFTATSTPYFNFDISKSNIEPKLLEPKEFKIKTTFFQIPRMLIWVAILVILLLFLAFRKPKQKVVYVQQPEQK